MNCKGELLLLKEIITIEITFPIWALFFLISFRDFYMKFSIFLSNISMLPYQSQTKIFTVLMASTTDYSYKWLKRGIAGIKMRRFRVTHFPKFRWNYLRLKLEDGQCHKIVPMWLNCLAQIWEMKLLVSFEI